MVEATLRVVDENVAYTGVHATRGKVVRAEPVAALYEQGRVRHMGAFTALEDQMCEFTPDLRKRDRAGPPRRAIFRHIGPPRMIRLSAVRSTEVQGRHKVRVSAGSKDRQPDKT